MPNIKHKHIMLSKSLPSILQCKTPEAGHSAQVCLSTNLVVYHVELSFVHSMCLVLSWAIHCKSPDEYSSSPLSYEKLLNKILDHCSLLYWRKAQSAIQHANLGNFRLWKWSVFKARPIWGPGTYMLLMVICKPTGWDSSCRVFCVCEQVYTDFLQFRALTSVN